jgi:hypothetical protein
MQLTLYSQHFQKLRRASSTGAGNGSVPSTPKTPKTPASRKKKFASNDNIDDEEAGDFQTPSKKRKRAPKAGVDEEAKPEIDFGGFEGQTATQFKLETMSSDNDVVDLEEE